MTYNRADIIILNKAEQYILKNIITKFIFDLKTLYLCLHMIEYKAKPIHSFFRTFKKFEAYIDMLNAKPHIQKELVLKFSYKAFKTF